MPTNLVKVIGVCFSLSLVLSTTCGSDLVNLRLCCKDPICKDNLGVWEAEDNLMSTGVNTNFSLITSFLNCNGEFRTNLSKLGSNETTRNWLYPNGYLRVQKEYYAPDEFCFERFTEDVIEVKVCIPECGKNRACIPKCCELDKVYGIGLKSNQLKGACQPVSTYFNPPLYQDWEEKSSPKNNNNKQASTFLPHYFHWKTGNFKYKSCYENKTTLIPLSHQLAHNLSSILNQPFNAGEFRIRKDGALLYKDLVQRKCKVEPEPKRFLCFDGVQDYWGLEPFKNSEDEYMVAICSKWEVENLVEGAQHEFIYGVLMLIVSFFPLVTSLIYLSLWSKQNVHGWTIAATTGSLFFMYLFLGLAFVVGAVFGNEKSTDTVGCTLIAILAHFFCLAAFSWLTVMCCDLWWTFRSLKPTTQRRQKGMKRYVKYSIFGWGLPTTFVVTGIILDFSYSSTDCTPHSLPGYGKQNCWITPSSQGVYNWYPIAVLLSLNVVFFGVTCCKLLKYRSNTRFATKRETDHWQGFVRFTKLFLVMGISWIFEIISWCIHGLELKWYWVIFDVVNITRAIGVFVVYVCKPDILVLLEDAHPTLKKLLRPFKRRCSDARFEDTGSTALVAANSPLCLLDAPNFQMNRLSVTSQ